MEKKMYLSSNSKAAHNMALICCCPCFLCLVVNDHSSSSFFFVMLLVVVTIAFVERIHVKIFCNERQSDGLLKKYSAFFLVSTLSNCTSAVVSDK
jgi:hypothetical protein